VNTNLKNPLKDLSEIDQEPIVVFFRKYNQKLMLLALAVLLGSIAFGFVRNRMVERSRSAAESFISLHKAFINWRQATDKLNTADKKELEALKNRLSSAKTSFDSLQTVISSGGGVYANYAQLYGILGDIISGEKGSLDKLKIEDLAEGTSVKTVSDVATSFLPDLKAFIVARGYLINTQDPDLLKKGREFLKKLIEKNSFTAAAAAKSLYLSAQSPEESKEFIAYFDQIKKQQPWQAELVNRIKSELFIN
jgi:hypothetical protein